MSLSGTIMWLNGAILLGMLYAVRRAEGEARSASPTIRSKPVVHLGWVSCTCGCSLQLFFQWSSSSAYFLAGLTPYLFARLKFVLLAVLPILLASKDGHNAAKVREHGIENELPAVWKRDLDHPHHEILEYKHFAETNVGSTFFDVAFLKGTQGDPYFQSACRAMLRYLLYMARVNAV